jgi:hypothetical protein
MTDTDEAPPPDPDKAFYVSSFGKKGSGKSVVCRSWFEPYPNDRIVIDPTHDLAADFRHDGIEFTELRGGFDLPARLPSFDPKNPKTYVFSPDMGAETAFDDMDRVVGLALGRGPTLLWCDEFGQQTTGAKTGPNMRRALHHGRHDDLTLLIACPRPMDINVLAISQADLVYMFCVNNPDDRQRIAKNIGLDVADVDEINEELKRQGPFWHMRYDDRINQVAIMPPLPRPRPGLNPRPPVGEPVDLAAAGNLDRHDAQRRQAAALNQRRRGGRDATLNGWR